jgi:uncharacterized membrane protein
MVLTPKLIGLIIGLLVGLLFVLAGWKVVLILLAFALAGHLIGAYLESQEYVLQRLRKLISRLFRP